MNPTGATEPGRTIWAKTFADTGEIKSLDAHLLDVAAVAWVIQESNPERLKREAGVHGISSDALFRLRVWLAALHDLGKCSAAFQAKSPQHWPAALLGEHKRLDDPGHWRMTATLLRREPIWSDVQKALPFLRPQVLKNLLAASAGHHGRPPAEDDWKRPIEPEIGSAALAEARRIIRDVTAILPPPADLVIDRETSKAISWQVSGLITVADWVGSDADFFGPGTHDTTASYFEQAKEAAWRALTAKGLLPQLITPRPGLRAVAPGLHQPHPMQVWADTVALPDGPCLAVIEDVTGSGKTEAALALASRMMAAGKGEGLYFALPTEATSNAMFDRLNAAHRGLYAPGTTPSLVLAHGRAHLSEPFETVRHAPSDTTEAQCNAWIADHRRKAFFAHVGAGTIDQAFLAILKKRHLTLRQFALAGRILIVDEAHAYDAYMEEELTRLLELHAMSGGSAVVLSATLPRTKRQSMIRAYHGSTIPTGTSFPLATLAARDFMVETEIAPAERSCRTVEVRRIPSVAEMHRLAAEAAANGAAVLVMRNAVDEAVASADFLRGAGHPVDLFHARFAQCDRAAIEKRVLERFGKEGTLGGREGQILVATQVVEQSLDVDFDVILTDLAPVDLVIQRAGRLWRHDRNKRPLTAPVLYVLSPDPVEADQPDWLGPVLGKGAYVYRNPAVMWRSARMLFGIGQIETPTGLRDLIEGVYGPGAEALPEHLVPGAGEAEGRELADRALAERFNTVKLSDGYGSLGDLPKDQEIGTRLGEEVRILRLARVDGCAVQPWADGRQSWARSELRVRETWLRGAAEPAELSAVIAVAKASWPDWERETNGPLIGVVDADGAVRLDGGATRLRYGSEVGLMRETR